MINALRAETRRLLARRLTLVAVLGLLALIGLFQLQVNSVVQPPSAADQAFAQREFDEYQRDWEANHEQWEADCQQSGGSAQECVQPPPDPTGWGLAATPYEQAVEPAVSFGAYLGGMVAFVVAASFIAAEVSTGSLANWLTFVPNRTRVYASKLVVAAVFSLVLGLAVGALTVGVSALLTTVHGQPVTGLGDVAAMAARGSVVTVVFGVLGYCLGLLTGSTGATIGVLLGGIFALYVRLIFTYTARWAQHLSPWSPDVNLQAVLNNGTTYVVSTGAAPTGADYDVADKTLGLVHGIGYWAVLLAALVLVTSLVFRRRDVT